MRYSQTSHLSNAETLCGFYFTFRDLKILASTASDAGIFGVSRPHLSFNLADVKCLK